MQQIISMLESVGISAERKSVYDDLELLRSFGLDIEKAKTKFTGYYIASREFELPELKLLVDAVQASKFITRKKSMELIKKLEKFASVHEAVALQRQVFVKNRIKSMNESIYYNVDKIHNGINDNKVICFKYLEYSISKENVFKRNGEKYFINPIALTWDDENYYMVGYDDEADKIKHYRVDKMVDIEVMEKARSKASRISGFDMASYTKNMFSMFGGTDKVVKIRFSNKLIGVVIDRFGKDISISDMGDGSFIVSTHVVVSPQFFGWLAGLGSGAALISPENVSKAYVEHIKSILNAHESI